MPGKQHDLQRRGLLGTEQDQPVGPGLTAYFPSLAGGQNASKQAVGSAAVKANISAVAAPKLYVELWTLSDLQILHQLQDSVVLFSCHSPRYSSVLQQPCDKTIAL